MAIENVIKLIIEAKNKAGPALKQAREQLEQTEKQASGTGTRLSRSLALGSQLARAGLLALAAAGGVVGAALFKVFSAADEAAASIAGMTGAGIEDIPKLRDTILKLAGKNDNPFQDIADAVRVVERAFKVFDPKDKEGLAQLLLDWKDVAGQNIDEAGKNFRKLILLYFGPSADANKALTEITDKILAVSKAVGIDPSSLASAVAELGATGRTYFKDFNQLVTFLATIGASGGDVNAAAVALRTFGEKIAEIRKVWKEGTDPDKATLEAFQTLGLSRETVQNEGARIGDLIMSSLKSAMKDGKLSEEEIAALNILFGSRVGEDMALAASATEQFSTAAQHALANYQGTLENAAKATDENVNSKIMAAWNAFTTQLVQSSQFEGVSQILAGLLEMLSGLAALNWDKLKTAFADLGEGLFKLILGADPAEVADALVWWWDSVVIPTVNQFFSNNKIFEASIVKAFIDVGAAGWNALKDGWNEAFRGSAGAIAFLRNRWVEFRKGFGEWWDGIIDVGRNIIAGFWKGMQQRWEDVKKGVFQMGSDFIQWWKERLGIQSPSTEMAAIGMFLIQGLSRGIDQALPGVRQQVESIVSTIVGTIGSIGSAISDLSKNEWQSGWANMGAVMAKALEDIGRYTDETTAGTLRTWAGYVTAFAALMDKHKGNILKALGELLVNIIEQKLIEIAVTSATEIAKAAIMAPLTLGATLAAMAPIGLAAAAGIVALEALKSRIFATYDVGTPYVPTDQLAIVHQGEMIIPKNFADGIRSGDVTLGTGQQPVVVQVYLDGRMVAQQVGRRMYDNLRQIVRADLPLLAR